MKEYVCSVWRVCWPDTEVQRCITRDRFILVKAMQILQYPVNPMFDQSAGCWLCVITSVIIWCTSIRVVLQCFTYSSIAFQIFQLTKCSTYSLSFWTGCTVVTVKFKWFSFNFFFVHLLKGDYAQLQPIVDVITQKDSVFMWATGVLLVEKLEANFFFERHCSDQNCI